MISGLTLAGLWKWAFTPTGKAVLLAVAVLAAVTLIRQDALNDCRADQLEAELEQVRKDQAAATEIAKEAQKRADAAESEIAELENLTNEIIQDTGDSCALSDDLRERLRQIQ